MKPYVINIGRSLGSGGRAIGQLLAKELGIAYFDREILHLAARQSGLCPEVFARHDEKNRFLHTLGNIIPFVGGGAPYATGELSEENLFRIQAEAIRAAAAKESCIFIGRCADYVLRDNPRCVNVFITAVLPVSRRRASPTPFPSTPLVRPGIAYCDRERASFYNFYSSRRWGAAATYHLCINSSVLGIERTAEFVRTFVESKLALND